MGDDRMERRTLFARVAATGIAVATGATLVIRNTLSRYPPCDSAVPIRSSDTSLL